MAAVPLARPTPCAAARDGRQLGLEGVEVGTDRRDPTAVEGGEQGLALGAADVGRRQVDSAHRGEGD